MVGTEKLSCVMWSKFRDIWFLVHLIINILIILISNYCWQNCTFFKNGRKTQSFDAFWLLSLCYKKKTIFFMNDIMDDYCLRVFRSRARARVCVCMCVCVWWLRARQCMSVWLRVCVVGGGVGGDCAHANACVCVLINGRVTYDYRNTSDFSHK